MPKVSQVPDHDMHQTHPGNANAYLGKVVLDALAVRQKWEVIDEEKKGHEERCQTGIEKKLKEENPVMEIAKFENAMALNTIKEETQFPQC
jgi:hypothetical protein